jgi:hypothetical protein
MLVAIRPWATTLSQHGLPQVATRRMMGRIEGGSGSDRRMDGRDSRDTLSAGDALPIMGQAVLNKVQPQ